MNNKKIRKLTVCWISVFVFIAGPPAFSAATTNTAELTFSQPQQIGLGTYLALADLNGDGKKDIAAVAIQDFGIGHYEPVYHLVWYENTNTTTVAFVPHNITNPPGQFNSVDPADLDGDGSIDLLISNIASVGYYKNDGGNPLQFTYNNIVSSPSIRSISSDMNGDGKIDVVALVTKRTPDDQYALVWLENNGQDPPQFTEHIIEQPTTLTQSFVSVDLNGDGHMDIVMSQIQSTVWFESNGANFPVFTKKTLSPESRFSDESDINGDGHLDLLVGKNLWINDGETTPTFTTQTLETQVPGNFPRAVDLDQDGKVDILSVSGSQSYFSRNSGTTTTTFTAQPLVTLPANASLFPQFADFNGDGNIDLLVYQNGMLSVLMSTGPAQPVSLLSPNGQDFLHGGDAMDVAWRSDLSTGGPGVGLELWRNMEAKVTSLINAYSEQGRGVERVILPEVTPRHDYRIRAVSLSNPQYFDFSDEPFTIAGSSSSAAIGWLMYY